MGSTPRKPPSLWVPRRSATLARGAGRRPQGRRSPADGRASEGRLKGLEKGAREGALLMWTRQRTRKRSRRAALRPPAASTATMVIT